MSSAAGAADRLMYSGMFWATKAMPSSAACDPARCLSSTVTRPALGTANPTARFNNVVLPAPFGPTSAVTCLSGTAGAAAVFTKIPHHAAEQRHDPVLVQSRHLGGGQPAQQRAAQPGQLRERHLAGRRLD
jgi:hypothetical protein